MNKQFKIPAGYFLWLLMLLVLISISLFQNRYHQETFGEGLKVKVRIARVRCSSGGTRSRLYFRDQRNEVKHVNVPHSKCPLFKTGDSITVFVNKRGDWHEIDPSLIK